MIGSKKSTEVNSGLVTVIITCRIKAGMMERAKRELEAICKTVMTKETACQGIFVHVESKNPQRLLIIEYWDSEEIFTGPHMQSPHMQTFLKTAEVFVDGATEFGFWHEILAAT